MKKFSEALYLARLKRKESLRQVASAIGISAMYLSELENGQKFPLKSKFIPKLAEHYNIPCATLVDLMEKERTMQAIQDAKDGNLMKVLAAARKSPEISRALSELLQQQGGLHIEPN